MLLAGYGSPSPLQEPHRLTLPHNHIAKWPDYSFKRGSSTGATKLPPPHRSHRSSIMPLQSTANRRTASDAADGEPVSKRQKASTEEDILTPSEALAYFNNKHKAILDAGIFYLESQRLQEWQDLTGLNGRALQNLALKMWSKRIGALKSHEPRWQWRIGAGIFGRDLAVSYCALDSVDGPFKMRSAAAP